MAPEDGRVGVMAHELGHLLLGWPDLYDTDYSSAGTGRWDLMAAGSWNAAGDRPAHPTAWCKLKAGWVTPVTVFGGSHETTLEPYETNAEIVKLPVGNETANEYFLLSNRQQAGFDDQIPASGMLIEHCDDSRSNNTDESRYLVDIEQCDGRRDLNLNANRGDADDVFPNGTNTTFDSGSTPSSRSYTGSDSGVAVMDITRSGNRISARVSNSVTTAGPQWFYNRRITATYAHHTGQFAWTNVEGIGWRRLKDGSVDGVGNLFDMCNEAVAHSRNMHVSIDGEWLYTAYLT
jgi:immune inhibitor A